MAMKRCSILLMLALLAAAGNALGADIEGDRAVHYPLTMARMQAVYEAQLNLAKVAAHDPQLGDSLGMDADEPTAKTIARYEAQPQIRKALAVAGLTPREYVYINLAYMSAAFGLAYQQQTHGKLDKVYDAANVAFYKSHQQALAALTAKYQRQAQALAGDQD